MNALQKTLIALILMGVAAFPSNQKLSEDEYRKAMAEVSGHYETKNWAAALKALDRLLAMTEGDQSRHASVLYNKACILALANRKAEAITTIRASKMKSDADWIAGSSHDRISQ